MPFLDMFIYLDPITKQIGHKPYRKPLNHRERIPWASHHPKDVKKGTYAGEMSRLATLSSNIDHYSDAVKDLQVLYRARGYPGELVKKWTKENYVKRWSQRLSEPRTPGEVFVLKSHFNPAWSAFNVHELGKTINESWLSSLHSYENAEQLRKQKRHLPVAGAGPAPRSPSPGPASGSNGPPPVRRNVVQRTLEDLWLRSSRALSEGSESAASVRSATPGSSNDDDGMHPFGAPHDVDENPSVASGSPPPSPASVPDMNPGRLIPTGRLLPLAQGRSLLVEHVLDIRSVGFFDKRWIVSRKRNKNVFDYTSIWKKNLLKNSNVDDGLVDFVDAWQ